MAGGPLGRRVMGTVAIDGDDRPTRNLRLTSLEAMVEPPTTTPHQSKPFHPLPTVKKDGVDATVNNGPKPASATPSGITREQVEGIVSLLEHLRDGMENLQDGMSVIINKLKELNVHDVPY